jgi:hypothetical protein
LTLGGGKWRTSQGYVGSSDQGRSEGVPPTGMLRLLFSLALLVVCAAAQMPAQEQHLQEPGSAAVLAHSTFAHGYRHGYEEGYHAGNTDINMGRALRGKLSDLRDVKLGYSSQFGSRAVFEKGFQAGLKAGYRDGYVGRTFRALENLRAVAASLEQSPSPADPSHTYFDQGFLTGYNDGYENGGANNSSAGPIDFHFVICEHSTGEPNPAALGSYCEGYRRGFVLGHADGFALRPGSLRLEASK